MGVEAAIANLKPKTRKLFDNIITILMIFMILYTFLSFLPYISAPMRFFSDPAFVNAIVIFVFLGIAYKLLHGGTIHVPEQSQQKTKIDMPNVWGVKPMGIKKSPTTTTKTHSNVSPRSSTKSSTKITGSWKCPKCQFLNVNRKRCKKCGYRHR